MGHQDEVVFNVGLDHRHLHMQTRSSKRLFSLFKGRLWEYILVILLFIAVYFLTVYFLNWFYQEQEQTLHLEPAHVRHLKHHFMENPILIYCEGTHTQKQCEELQGFVHPWPVTVIDITKDPRFIPEDFKAALYDIANANSFPCLIVGASYYGSYWDVKSDVSKLHEVLETLIPKNSLNIQEVPLS